MNAGQHRWPYRYCITILDFFVLYRFRTNELVCFRFFDSNLHVLWVVQEAQVEHNVTGR